MCRADASFANTGDDQGKSDVRQSGQCGSIIQQGSLKASFTDWSNELLAAEELSNCVTRRALNFGGAVGVQV